MRINIPATAAALLAILPSLASADKTTMRTADGFYWTFDSATLTTTLSDDPPATEKRLTGSYVLDCQTWQAAPTAFWELGEIKRPLGWRYSLRLVGVGDYIELEGADPLRAGLGLLLPPISLATNVSVDLGGRIMFSNGRKPAASLLFGVTVRL